MLILLSIVAVGCAIERYLVFKNIRLEDFSDKKSLELELTKKLHVIATIGSNAPYLGLLGTVLGIMLTFYTMGSEGFLVCLLVGGIASATKGVTEAVILLFTGAPSDIILQKAVIEGTGAVIFGMLGSLPVPAIVRKLRTNRLIPDPGEGWKGK